MAVSAEYKFYVDWNSDNTFDDAQEDITADVMEATWERGFNGPPPEYCSAGQLSMRLRNPTGKYTLGNGSSPIIQAHGAGSIRPGLRVRVDMRVDGTWHVEFEGRIDMITTSTPETLATGEAELTALCPIANFVEGEADIDVAFQEDVWVGDAIKSLLEAEGVTDVSLIDQGRSTIDCWWAQNEKTRLNLIRELQDADLGRFFSSKDGRYVYHDRHHLFTVSARATYGDESGSLRMWEPVLENPWPYVYNSVRAQVRTFDLTAEDTPLVVVTDQENGQGGRPIKLPVGEVTKVYIELTEKTSAGNFLAVKSWSDPYAAVTLWMNTQEDGEGVDVSNDPALPWTVDKFGTRMLLTITNNYSADCYVIKLIGNGQAVVESEPIPIKADDLPSQDVYKRKEYPNPSNWITDQADGQRMIEYVVSEMKDPRPRITFRIIGNVDSNHLNEVADIDVDDRIHVKDSSTFGLYVDDDFIVDRLIHTVRPEMPGGLHYVTVMCTRAPLTELEILNAGYTSKIVGEGGPPAGLYANGVDPAGAVIIGIMAKLNTAGITEGEIRCKFYESETPESVDLRTVAEGGTMVNNDDTERILTGLAATPLNGVNYQFTSDRKGRWYYAARLKNDFGWSLWSDGNSRPIKVTDFIDTESGAGADTGPPGDSGSVTATFLGSAVLPRFIRPSENASVIFWAACQVRDASQGAWYELDSNDGPAELYWDGSGVDCVYDKATGTITSPSGFGTATRGMIMMDVRNNSTWDRDWCQWGSFETGAIVGNAIRGCTGFRPVTPPDSGLYVWNNIRIKIVRPPWEWDTDGYLGGQAGRGVSELDFIMTDQQKGDRTTKEFVFPVVPLPAGLTMGNVQIRVWVENKICRSMVGTSAAAAVVDTGNPSGASGLKIVTHEVDPIVPAGMMRFRYNRDTVNYKNIWAMAFWLSRSLPGEGPFAVERRSANVLEEGTCTVTGGSLTITSITRLPDPTVVGKVFCIYTDDGTPDSDLDGQVVMTEGLDAIGLSSPFKRSGTFSYAIIDCWWDMSQSDNFNYYQFLVPTETGGNIEATEWETPDIPRPSGTFYVTGCSRNPWGVGTRITAGSADPVIGSFCIIVPFANPLVLDCSLVMRNGKIFITTLTGDTELQLTNASCGQPIALVVNQDGIGGREMTLGSMVQLGETVNSVILSSGASLRDYVGIMYYGPASKYDVVCFVKGY